MITMLLFVGLAASLGAMLHYIHPMDGELL